MAKLSKLLNLAPDFLRSKTTWISFFMLVYIAFKYSQHLISLDQLFSGFYVVLFGASLRDAIGKVLPALGGVIWQAKGLLATKDTPPPLV